LCQKRLRLSGEVDECKPLPSIRVIHDLDPTVCHVLLGFLKD